MKLCWRLALIWLGSASQQPKAVWKNFYYGIGGVIFLVNNIKPKMTRINSGGC